MSRKILVTGSSSGLGFATTDLLLSQGYEVLGVDINNREISNENYTHLVMDLTKVDIGLIRKHVSDGNWFGFVHCAGTSKGSVIGDLMEEDWDYSMELNLNSAMKISKLADELMIDGGRILFVSSPVAIAGARKTLLLCFKSCNTWTYNVAITLFWKKTNLCKHTFAWTNDYLNDKRLE